jgi:hypothetical protein
VRRRKIGQGRLCRVGLGWVRKVQVRNRKKPINSFSFKKILQQRNKGTPLAQKFLASLKK